MEKKDTKRTSGLQLELFLPSSCQNHSFSSASTNNCSVIPPCTSISYRNDPASCQAVIIDLTTYVSPKQADQFYSRIRQITAHLD